MCSYIIKDPAVRPDSLEPIRIFRDLDSLSVILTTHASDISQNILTCGPNIETTLYSSTGKSYRLIGIITRPWSFLEQIRSIFFRILWPFLSLFPYVRKQTYIYYFTRDRAMTLLAVPMTEEDNEKNKGVRKNLWDQEFYPQLLHSQTIAEMDDIITRAILCHALYYECLEIIAPRNKKDPYPDASEWGNRLQNIQTIVETSQEQKRKTLPTP